MPSLLPFPAHGAIFSSSRVATMGFDLNAEPLGLEEAFIDLNKPPDRGSFQIYGALLELNEELQHEEEHTYNDEAQQTQIAGGQQVNNPG